MRWILPLLCLAIAFPALADDKSGCDAGDKAQGSCCEKALALVTQIKSTECPKACAQMLMSAIGLKCEKTASELIAKIKATECNKTCAQLVADCAGKCGANKASGCDATATQAGCCPETVAALVAKIKSTECKETCAKELMAAVPGMTCAKTAAALVEQIKTTECPKACTEIVMVAAKKCAQVCADEANKAKWVKVTKLAAAVRVLSNDEVAAQVLISEMAGLKCKDMAGKIVAELRAAGSDEDAAKLLHGHCAYYAGETCGGAAKTEAKAECEKGSCEAKKDAPKN